MQNKRGYVPQRSTESILESMSAGVEEMVDRARVLADRNGELRHLSDEALYHLIRLVTFGIGARAGTSDLFAAEMFLAGLGLKPSEPLHRIAVDRLMAGFENTGKEASASATEGGDQL